MISRRGFLGCSIATSARPVPGGFQQFTVDLKLAGLSLGQIVAMLYGVQTLPMPVTVSNLHVRQRTQDPHSYDVDMTCMSFARMASSIGVREKATAM